MIRKFRIHGDNIIECERTVKLISAGLGIVPRLSKLSTLYKPTYDFISLTDTYEFELLPGHDRWGINIGNILQEYGGPLREGADSYITYVQNDKEYFILVIEYCSALPAGNNAWQRNGRAYTAVMAGLPYIYFAEIGGVELDEDRKPKSLRFPNPIVPFSYIAVSKRLGGECIPVYRPHPSISRDIYQKYKTTFGYNESIAIIKNVIENVGYNDYVDILNQKSLRLVQILSQGRKDTLNGTAWSSFFKSINPIKWLSRKQNYLPWKKPFSAKVMVSSSFSTFKDKVMAMGLGAIGASKIPISFVPTEKIPEFNKLVNTHFNTYFRFDPNQNLTVVWISGYKPRGDDSRPDRGLTSLARMVLGNSTKILCIVYGPAKSETYSVLKSCDSEKISANGLWQSIMELSDFAIFDSINYPSPICLAFTNNRKVNHKPVVASYTPAHLVEFGEHDIDSSIHQIFAHCQIGSIKESFCNPPGGDWSGISYFEGDWEYRWTSLPRVSELTGKRPDHIIELTSNDGRVTFLSIESKGEGSALEKNIGLNLKTYVESILKTPITASRSIGNPWHSDDRIVNVARHQIISIGAFIYKNSQDIHSLLLSRKLDAIIAFEFSSTPILHLAFKPYAKIVKATLDDIRKKIGQFVVQVD